MSKTAKPKKSSTFGSRLTSVVSVALTLVVIGLLAQTGIVARRVTDDVRHKLTVTVQAKPGTNDININRLKRLIGSNPAVESYKFMSADMVLAQEVQFIGEEVVTLLDENPYSAEYEVHLKPSAADKDGVERFRAQMLKDADVEDVITDLTVVENVSRSFRNMALVLSVLGAVLLIISLVLITATVSLSIYSRRFLIRTMKLVGATPGFIRAPFIRAGLANGILSGLIASAILAGAQLYGIHSASWLAPMLSWADLGFVCAGIVVLGAIICPLAAWIAATRYLRRNYDALYRK